VKDKMSGNAIDTALFKQHLLKLCGFSFENERQTALIAGIRQRMSSCGIATATDYLGLLLTDARESDRLVELLTVNETYFFRESDHLRLISDRIIPKLLAQRPSGPIRILSAGCSTGEEPYTLAIMLRDAHGPEISRLVSILGVDIDSSVVAVAKRGVYEKGAFRGKDPVMLSRHFEPCRKGGWQLRQELRDQVRFEQTNLMYETYPTSMRGMDIIVYRNVSIYFPKQVQKDVFRRLAGCLNEGGYILVGATETMQHNFGELTLTEMDSLFVYRKTSSILGGDRRHTRRDGNAPMSGSDKNATQLRRSSVVNRNAVPAELGKASSGKPQSRAAAYPQADVRSHFDDALEHAREGRPDAALMSIKALLALDPDFVKAHTLRATILMSLNRLEDAKAACERALINGPLCLEAKLILGMAALQEEDYDTALKRFREAIYLDPSCWLSHFYLAEIMFMLGERKRAKGAYETAAKILASGSLEEHGRQFFPLVVNAQPFVTICRHKLALLK